MTNLLIRLFMGKDAKALLADGASPSAAARTRAGLVASVVCIACNVLLCAAKAVVGLLMGSVSIVADAVNNLSDASSNIVSLIGFKLASKPADSDHPFGHGRFEYLAGLAVAVIVCALGLDLIKESVEKVASPEPAQFGLPVVAVLVASMLVKTWMMAFNRSLGRHIDSETLLATATDSRNDVITTGAVLICAVIGQLTGLNLDGWAGIAVGLFVTVSGASLIRDTVSPLLGRAPDDDYVESIRSQILSYPGVLGTHDLMVHDYGPGREFVSAHVEMDGNADAFKNHEVIDQIERDFKRKTGSNLTLHYDPVAPDDASDDPLAWLNRQLEKIDPSLTAHDLLVKDDYVTFDLVKPADCPLSDDEALGRALATVAERWPEAPCSINLDHGYLTQG